MEEEQEVSAEALVPPDESAGAGAEEQPTDSTGPASAGEGQPTEATAASAEGEADSPDEPVAEDEGPQLVTTVIELERLSVPEQEGDILAIAHRLPGVTQVHMEWDTLTVVHDPDRVNRARIVKALERWGFYAAE